MLNEQDAIGLVGWPLYGIHDGLGKYGIYVHGPWLNDVALGQSASSAIYIGPSGGSPEALAEMMRAPRPGYSIRQEHPRPQAMVAALLQQVDRLPQAGRTGDLAAAASYFTHAASDAASRGRSVE